MTLPNICLRCFNKTCETFPSEELHFCEYDIAVIKINNSIIKKEALVPLRHISENLRHAVNPVLNVIVEELNLLEPSLSLRRLDLSTPVGKILAATKVVDMFVQMISGVNEFKPSITGAQHDPPRKINSMIKKYHDVYSVLRNSRRNPHLTLNVELPESIFVNFCPDIYEYIVSILVDNAWKYSEHHTSLTVQIKKTTTSKADILFVNESKPIAIDADVFSKGYKSVKESDGFGYGLYWARILTDYYNRLMNNHDQLLELKHRQEILSDKLAIQTFVLENTDYIERG